MIPLRIIIPLALHTVSIEIEGMHKDAESNVTIDDHLSSSSSLTADTTGDGAEVHKEEWDTYTKVNKDCKQNARQVETTKPTNQVAHDPPVPFLKWFSHGFDDLVALGQNILDLRLVELLGLLEVV